ncbi:DUF3850 domain-containing protein [Enterococcus casseliflavus]|uniref:DUF3850 domain-containing protein n=1 Tax=Enterococcus casseliflavus TaxID=37734 RepID=UPI002DBA54DC|nr:DUF3850 domain-containing protein [Enterococcus casseliflavus]MEB8419054.1 DUF3850 domain-containing protein [Enterococcus casseliflavus]
MKIEPQYFEAIVDKRKQFEIRKNDRNFQVGDQLILKEWNKEGFTGRSYQSEITYITDYMQKNGYVVLGMRAVELDEPKKSVDVPENVAELLDYYRDSSDVDLLALILTFHDWYYSQNEDTQHDKAVDWLIKNPEKFMRAWLDGYDSKKKLLESNFVADKKE